MWIYELRVRDRVRVCSEYELAKASYVWIYELKVRDRVRVCSEYGLAKASVHICLIK